jgi:glycosyltransferase involved in cell wall biosynthesis
MRILFAHQGYLAQFKYLALAFARAGHEVIFMSAPVPGKLSGVKQVSYALTQPAEASDPLLIDIVSALRYGRAARETAKQIRDEGFIPDVIVIHPGWGEGLFLRDVFPRSKMICFLEFFFSPEGNFFDFEGKAPDLDTRAQLHMRNAPLLLALNESAWNISPTRWQKHLFPAVYQQRTTTIHEGVNIQKFVKRQGVEVETPNGSILRDGMEIVTFVARHLEPVRGLNSFMRAADLITKNRPKAHIAVVGREEGGYGVPPPNGTTHKEIILRELDLDLSRVHFFGCVDQSTVVRLLQLSKVHLFLTYPFLISWSVLEAMSCSCVVLGSDTGPVREIINDGVNGLLIDFFNHAKFAELACQVLESPKRFADLGEAARQSIVDNFDALKNVKRQVALVSAVASGLELPQEEIIHL